MPSPVQTSLLRVLQEKEITRLGESQPRKVDVRIICATHHDLQEQVAQHAFRADLLYRIRVGRIHLPPLRERQEDIPLLIWAFVSQCRKAMGKLFVQDVSPDALQRLARYPWPGNIRETEKRDRICRPPMRRRHHPTTAFSSGTSRITRNRASRFRNDHEYFRQGPGTYCRCPQRDQRESSQSGSTSRHQSCNLLSLVG